MTTQKHVLQIVTKLMAKYLLETDTHREWRNKRHSIINVLSNAIINKKIWDNVNINFVFGQGKNIFKKSIKALHRLDKEEETSIKLIKL